MPPSSPPHQIRICYDSEHALIRVPQSHVRAFDVNIGKRNFPFAGDFANLRTAHKGVVACQAFPNRRNLLAVLA